MTNKNKQKQDLEVINRYKYELTILNKFTIVKKLRILSTVRLIETIDTQKFIKMNVILLLQDRIKWILKIKDTIRLLKELTMSRERYQEIN